MFPFPATAERVDGCELRIGDLLPTGRIVDIVYESGTRRAIDVVLTILDARDFPAIFTARVGRHSTVVRLARNTYETAELAVDVLCGACGGLTPADDVHDCILQPA